jgi:ABC-type transport system involved in multi-copper enzyme maturation permease subunit
VEIKRRHDGLVFPEMVEHMDAPVAAKPIKINRWLPYWAVFQADLQHTMRSWVYRCWAFVSTVAAVGYLMYKFGVVRELKVTTPASELVRDLLCLTVLGNVTLILMMTVGSISSERGSLADSVLSRGISRWGYFLGKWHARLVSVLGTYLVITASVLVGSYYLLHDDLSLVGSLLALATVTMLLAVVVTGGVTVSAMTNNTVVGLAVLWIILYGSGFALSLLPLQSFQPEFLLSLVQNVLRGHYNLTFLGRIMGGSAAACLIVAVVGMVAFSRRDV